jgi:hypothetical protein
MKKEQFYCIILVCAVSIPEEMLFLVLCNCNYIPLASRGTSTAVRFLLGERKNKANRIIRRSALVFGNKINVGKVRLTFPTYLIN